MLLRSDITGTQPLNQTSAVQHVTPTGDLRQDIANRLNQFDLGQQFRADVLSRTDNGNALVKLADTVVQMNLPKDASVGDKVSLTLIAREPRLTFLYEPQSGSVQSSLSAAGRVLSNILQTAGQGEGGQQSALVGKTPVVPSSASMLLSPQVAAGLRNAITQSGLFYESHLAQWLSGNKTMNELKLEPQAQMKLQLQEGMTALLAEKSAAAQVQTQPQQQVQTQTPAQLSSQAQALAQVQVPKSGEKVVVIAENEPGQKQGETVRVLLGTESKMEPVVDREAAQMIRMQLDTMEQRRIMWHGELWPGQEMEWEISEDTPKKQNEANEPQEGATWQSVMRLELPALGSVSVTMRLTGDQVQVHLEAKNPETVFSLRNSAPKLVLALSDIGTHLDYLAVKDGTA